VRRRRLSSRERPSALVAVHRALIDDVRRRTIAGAGAHAIARGLRAEAKRALALLEHGLGDYPSTTEDRSEVSRRQGRPAAGPRGDTR
jgi:hypothetical protein